MRRLELIEVVELRNYADPVSQGSTVVEDEWIPVNSGRIMSPEDDPDKPAGVAAAVSAVNDGHAKKRKPAASSSTSGLKKVKPG